MLNTFFAPLLPLLAMLLSMAAYQVSASLAKQLMLQLEPLTVVTLRLCFASLMVFIMLRSWQVLHLLRFAKWPDLMAYSAALCGMNVLFYLSLGQLPQGIAVGLEFTGPLLLAFLSLQQRQDALWVMFAVLGIVLLLPWQGMDHSIPLQGAMYALGAGMCWAFYIYFGHKVVRQAVGMHALTIAICLSALTLLPLTYWVDAPSLFKIDLWPQAVAIAFLATALPYALDLYALKQLSKVSYGTLSSLAPAMAVIAGFLLLGERISVLQALAVGCIVLASIGITLSQQRQMAQNSSQI